MRKLIFAAFSLALLGGCASKYYVAAYELERRGVMADDGAHQVAATAKSSLRPGATIAFYPPDSCFDLKAAQPGAVEVRRLLALTCGVLMTELEAAATGAGFKVVTWQALKGQKERALDYAKQLGVDVIFEVNELDINSSARDLFSASEVSFHQQMSLTGRVPQVVKDVESVARQCRTRLFEHLEKEVNFGASVTADLKMVSVTDAKVQWFYRRTAGDDVGGKFANEHYYEAVSKGAGAGPVTLISLGIPLAITPAVVDLGDAGTAMIASGVIATLGGIVWAVVGSSSQTPEEVICRTPSVPNPFVVATADTPEVKAAGSSFRFESEKSASKDTVEEYYRKLVRRITADFIQAVQKLIQ